jgi:hypothetical protein
MAHGYWLLAFSFWLLSSTTPPALQRDVTLPKKGYEPKAKAILDSQKPRAAFMLAFQVCSSALPIFCFHTPEETWPSR